MKANLAFEDFHVLKTIYEANPFTEEEEEQIAPSISLQISYQDDKKEKANLILEIELGDENLEKNSFFLYAKVLGGFSVEVDKEEDEEKVVNLYKHNATAILFPYLRSLVSDMTSKGSQMPIILPPMNVMAMIEENGEIQEINNK